MLNFLANASKILIHLSTVIGPFQLIKMKSIGEPSFGTLNANAIDYKLRYGIYELAHWKFIGKLCRLAIRWKKADSAIF